MSVFFAPPASSSSATDPTRPSEQKTFDRVESIDMKNVSESEILKTFLHLTKAQPYEANTEEKAELQEVEDFNRMSQADREAQERLNKTRAQEKAMLEQAKGAVS